MLRFVTRFMLLLGFNSLARAELPPSSSSSLILNTLPYADQNAILQDGSYQETSGCGFTEVSVDPVSEKRANKIEMVKLKNGSEVPRALLAVTMITLQSLADDMLGMLAIVSSQISRVDRFSTCNRNT